MDINRFADLSNDEFMKMHTGLKIETVEERTFLLAGDYNQTNVNWAIDGYA